MTSYEQYCVDYHRQRKDDASSAWKKLQDNQDLLKTIMSDREVKLTLEAVQHYIRET
jgi:hypothetical protein